MHLVMGSFNGLVLEEARDTALEQGISKLPMRKALVEGESTRTVTVILFLLRNVLLTFGCCTITRKRLIGSDRRKCIVSPCPIPTIPVPFSNSLISIGRFLVGLAIAILVGK